MHFPLDENGNALLIDPADPTIDPEDHLKFNFNDEDDINFGRISSKNDEHGECKRGAETIKTIGLDRLNCRRDRIVGLRSLYSAYLEIRETADETTKKQKAHTFELKLGANNAHAAFARAFAREKKLDTRFGVRIPRCAQVEPE